MSEKFKESFEKKFWRLKMYRAWNISLFCIKQKQWYLKKSTIRPCFKPLTMCIVAPESSLLDCTCWSVQTSRLLSEGISFDCGAKGKLLKLKYIFIYILICFTNKQIARERESTTRAGKLSDLDQQTDHLLVIFENLEETLRIIMSENGNNWEKLNRLLAIWAVLRTIGIVRQVVGMHRKGILRTRISVGYLNPLVHYQLNKMQKQPILL